MLAWATMLVALGVGGAPGESRPTSGAMRRAFETGRVAVVEVESARGKGLGVLVGSGGEVVTSVRYVELESAKVRRGDVVHPAEVRFARAEPGVALVRIQAEGPFPAVAVRVAALPAGSWVVGVEGGPKGARSPRLGRVRRARAKADPAFLETSLSLAPGSPVLDLDGKLVGVVVSRIEGGSRALAVSALRTVLSEAKEPPP